MQMSLRTDRALLRATARSTRYLLVSLTAPTTAPRDGRTPIHVGIVLDRSGSMDGEHKFALAQQAVASSLRMLRPDDRFTLVAYDDSVDMIMPSTLATPEATRVALQRLQTISPRGGTDLYAGWMSGAAQMLEHLVRDGVSRVLLLTDGLANTGVVESPALVSAAGDLRRRGIATSTFGVGLDFDERVLRDIAHEGGGQSYYMDTPAQITDLLTSELGEALEVVRRGMLLHIGLPPGVECKLLNRYRSTHAHGDDELIVDVGDVTSGQELSLVVRLCFPEDRAGAQTNVRVSTGGAVRVSTDVEQQLSWHYADHEANNAQPRDVVVDREVATLYAARARAEATEANRHGDMRHARAVLEATARRIRTYANGDPVLDGLYRGLLADVEMYAERCMSAQERKQSFYVAESVGRNRDIEGKARRHR